MKTSEVTSTAGSDGVTKRVIAVELPTGKVQNVLTSSTDTVTLRDFKVICELQFGIPTNLQRLSSRGHSELQDWLALHCLDSESLKMTVPVWWNKFICAVLDSEVENVYRRIQLPMQQVSKQERAFVALFMACCLGSEALVSRIMNLSTMIDAATTTSTGRSLLHAAAAGSKCGCLELIKSLMGSSMDYLNRRDNNKETPIEIARRLKNTEIEKLLYKLMYQDSQECGTIESSVDLTLEFEIRKEQNNNELCVNGERKTNIPTICCEIAPRAIKQTAYENSDSDLIPKAGSSVEIALTNCHMEGRSPSDSEGSNQKKAVESPPKVKFRDMEVEDENSRRDGEVAESVSVNKATEKPEGRDQTNQPETFAKNVNRSPGPPSEEAVVNKLRRPQVLNKQPLVGRRIGRVNKGNESIIDVGTFRPASSIPRSIIGVTINDDLSLYDDDSAPDDGTHLPALENQNLVSQKIQSSVIELRNDLAQRLNRRGFQENRPPVSAPTSPLCARRTLAPTSGLVEHVSSAPASPNTNRRASEPLGAAGFQSRHLSRLNRPGRDSVTGSSLTAQGKERKKSRSICEVTLAESLQEHMESEMRLERPWNAWILAKRKDSTVLPVTLETDTNLSVPRTEANSRRMSFEKWFSNKELDQLRQAHAKSQVDGANEALGQGRQFKGKSFEEWMYEKKREIERQRERIKELDESQKEEEVKRQWRRRESQVRYDKWLKKKEEQSLIQEQQLLDQERDKLVKMRKKWEEEDLKKKQNPAVAKVTVFRTRSLPGDGNPGNRKVSRNRVGSLQPSTQPKMEGL